MASSFRDYLGRKNNIKNVQASEQPRDNSYIKQKA